MSGTDLEARKGFAALPRPLRRKCSFGNDLTDEDPVADRILRSEWSITGGRGTIVLFDTKGFHRGGMVQQGERVVLTCVLG